MNIDNKNKTQQKHRLWHFYAFHNILSTVKYCNIHRGKKNKTVSHQQKKKKQHDIVF